MVIISKAKDQGGLIKLVRKPYSSLAQAARRAFPLLRPLNSRNTPKFFEVPASTKEIYLYSANHDGFDRDLRMRIFLLGAAPSLSRLGSLSGTADSSESLPSKLARTGGNTGNQIIAYGLLESLTYDEVSWSHEIGPERVNEEYDVILIAAANFLHTGFDFSGMASFIESTDLRCVMIGVGAQSSDYSPKIALHPGTDRLMRVVAERSKVIGARGSFTLDVLSEMGIHNVQVTGCPSHYMNGATGPIVRKPGLGEKPRIAVNSSRDVVRHAFDRERMIKVVCGLASEAIRMGADFVPQSELEEIELSDSNDAAKKNAAYDTILRNFPFYKEVGSEVLRRDWFFKRMKVYWDVQNWQRDMASYDFVTGNRFHGNMIALQAGTPACVICHDTRTTEMCEFLGLPHVQIADVESVNIQDLYDRVDPAAMSARYAEIYPKFQHFLTQNGLIPKLQTAARAAS